MRYKALFAAALLLTVGLAPAFGAAQPGPTGPDIPVGSDSLALCPIVAMSANGDFEVVWNHYYSESHHIPQGIFARHFDRQGRPTQSAQIRLDVPEPAEASAARVVALPDSGYFVTWFEARGPRVGTVGRFLSPEGRPRSPVLRLTGVGSTVVALVVVNDSLLFAWQEGYLGGIRAQRYDFAGHALGNAVLLTERLTFGYADLAPLSDSFVAAWQRWNGKSRTIIAQRFSLAGERLGPELRVNESRVASQLGPRVASDGNDRFAVAWTTTVMSVDPQTGRQIYDDETRARLFDSGGAIGPETHPNQLSTGNQLVTGLAMNRRGLALVAWNSDRNSATSLTDIAGRFLDPSGQPASKAFPLLQNLAGVDSCPSVANSGDDEWVVAWVKQGTGIFARRLVEP